MRFHRTIRRALRRAMPLLLGAALGAGCGVLTVDVDVYKGPLSNQPDVQTEQVVAMAVAAKPLLTELRNRLEFTDDLALLKRKHPFRRVPPNLSRGQVACLIRGYTDAYLPEPPFLTSRATTQESERRSDPETVRTQAFERLPLEEQSLVEQLSRRGWFTDYQAIHVNAILGLYQDAPPPELTCALEPILDAQQAYFAIASKRPQGAAVVSEKQVQQENERHRASELKATQIESSSKKPEMQNPIGKGTSAPLSAVQLQRMQSVTGLYSSEIRTLKQEADPSQTPVSIQDLLGYLEKNDAAASTALHRVWQLLVAFVAYTKPPGFAAMPNSLEISERFERAISNATDPLALLVLVHTQDPADQPEIGWLKDELARQIGQSGAVEVCSTDEAVLRDELRQAFDTIRPAFLRAFRTDPERFARALLRADNYYSRTAPLVLQPRPGIANLCWSAELQTRFQNIAASAEDRQFGLVPTRWYSMTDKRQLLNRQGWVGEDVVAAFHLTEGGGLERGRGPRGLDTLIEEYRAARVQAGNSQSSDPASGKDRVETARSRLLEELIHFSEKLTFLANNQSLLGSRALDASNDSSDPASTVIYARLLQSIGNAILVQIDELRRVAEHDRALESQWAREVRAFRATAADSVHGIIGHVADLLAVEQGAAAHSADDLRRQAADAKRSAEDATKKQVASQRLAETQQIQYRAALLRAKDAQDKKEQADEDAKRSKAAAATATAVAATQPTRQPEAVAAQTADENAQQKRAKASAELDDANTALLKSQEQVKSTLDQIVQLGKLAAEQTKQAGNFSQQAEQQSGRAADLTSAVTAVRTYAKNVSESLEPTAKPADVIAVMLFQLRKQAEDAAADPKRAQEAKELGTAISVLASRSFDSLTSAEIQETEHNPQAVIDQLVARLEAQYRDLVQAGGSNTPQAINTKAAIDAAYDYRARMVYIRPSSIFVKNSYPASSLQLDTGVGWQNMLAQQGARQFPLLGESFANGKTDFKTIREIDRQFWQNINRVRVAGGGITNYVIAKDDIGNWYVKSYVGDPKPIIKAAQTVALYNASSVLNQNVIDRAKAIEAGNDTGPNPEPTIVDKQVQALRGNYNASTTTDAADTRDLVVNKLKAEISSAWKADTSLAPRLADLQSALDSAAAALTTDIPDKPDATRDQTLGGKIIDSLRKAKDFNAKVLSGIDSKQFGTDSDPLVKPKKDAMDTKQKQGATDKATADASKKAESDAKAALDHASADVAARDKELCDAKIAAATNTNQAAQDDVLKKQGALDAATATRDDLNKTYQAATQKRAQDEQTAAASQKDADQAKTDYDSAKSAGTKAAATARQACTKVVRDDVSKIVDRRLSAAGGYASALKVISDSVSPTTRPSANPAKIPTQQALAQ